MKPTWINHRHSYSITGTLEVIGLMLVDISRVETSAEIEIDSQQGSGEYTLYATVSDDTFTMISLKYGDVPTREEHYKKNANQMFGIMMQGGAGSNTIASVGYAGPAAPPKAKKPKRLKFFP